MADPSTDATPGDMFDDYTDRNAGADVLPATEHEQLSTRARTQIRLTQARTSVRDVTLRARQSARLAALSVRRAGESTDAADLTSPTLAQRAQAYRAHILSAGAAAVIALLVGVLNRRGQRHNRDTLDLGNWHLHAEPINE